MANINDALQAALAARSTEDIAKMDQGGSFPKIEKSGIYDFKIIMAKANTSKDPESQSTKLELELETEAGAKVYWTSGYYLNRDGSFLDKDGKLSGFAAEVIALYHCAIGEEKLPEYTTANIKETKWTNGKPDGEETVSAQIDRTLIGSFISAKVFRIKKNKMVKTDELNEKGYNIWAETNEEKIVNDVKSFYNIDTHLTSSETILRAPAERYEKDLQYCEEHPIIDQFKPVANAPQAARSNAGAATNAAASANKPARSFGSRR